MKARHTVLTLQAQKGHTPLVCLTVYTAPLTKIMDPHVDILLVGDTVGMVLYGMDSTLPVTVEMMIAHGKAVVKSSHHGFVVVDMPFSSYQVSKEEAFHNAARIMKETGCQAVKMEGGAHLAETVSFLSQRGIPVMGHVGLMPQHVHALGGFRYQGRSESERHAIQKDAEAITEAGAFAIVLEGIQEALAANITKQLSIPTMGIGASPACDGQVLVTDDMLGLYSEFTPRFVKQYTHLAPVIEDAVKRYAEEVRARTFPAKEHCFR